MSNQSQSLLDSECYATLSRLDFPNIAITAGLVRRYRYVYLVSSLLCVALVLLFFSIQAYFFLSNVTFLHTIVPCAVGGVFGFTVATVFALQKEYAGRMRLFEIMSDLAQEFIYFRDVQGNYLYVSPSCENLTGFSPAEFYATANFMDRVIAKEDQKRWASHVHKVNNGATEDLVFRIKRADGSMRWIKHICADVTDTHGNIIGVRSTNIDITEKVELINGLEKQVNTDDLTQIPNRHYIEKYIKQCQHSVSLPLNDGSPHQVGVMFIDLDRFKYTNEAHGHSCGDEVLKIAANRLKYLAMRHNFKTARFGSDQFIAVIRDDKCEIELMAVANLILDNLRLPYDVATHHIHLSASIGISRLPDDTQEPSKLIQYAYAAMYQAKWKGRARIDHFLPNAIEYSTEHLRIETALYRAIENQQLTMVFQPRIDTHSKRVLGFEALARWSIEGKPVSPDMFIAIAEQSDLIDKVTDCLFTQALLHAVKVPHVVTSFNLSAREFQRADLCEWLLSKVEDIGCNPSCIEFEITESVLINDPGTTLERINQLRSAGFRISLDDFGTGYSSLSYIRDFNFDCIKLDRSFIAQMENGEKDRAIIKNIAALCRDIGVKMVAEGIETQQQFESVCSFGITEVQGYMFAMPMPSDDAIIYQQQHEVGIKITEAKEQCNENV